MQVSEQDATDLLSEVLLGNSNLNDDFIAMIEDIHMRLTIYGYDICYKK